MIIGISGKMQSGKNTVASIINQLTNNMFVEKAFADKLKECISIITGIPRLDLEKEEVKNSYLPNEWNRVESMTVRTLLQEFGTEVGRQIHPNFWINALFSNYKPYYNSLEFNNPLDAVEHGRVNILIGSLQMFVFLMN